MAYKISEMPVTIGGYTAPKLLEDGDLGLTPAAGPACPAGCHPVAAGQCGNVLRRAIRDAIFLASNAASKLEASPRDCAPFPLLLRPPAFTAGSLGRQQGVWRHCRPPVPKSRGSVAGTGDALSLRLPWRCTNRECTSCSTQLDTAVPEVLGEFSHIPGRNRPPRDAPLTLPRISPPQSPREEEEQRPLLRGLCVAGRRSRSCSVRHQPVLKTTGMRSRSAVQEDSSPRQQLEGGSPCTCGHMTG